MTDAKLDPKSLTGEERAIVDHEASRFHRDWTGEARYQTALGICEPIILARRAIFGGAEKEPTCILHEEIVRDGPSKWYCETHDASEGARVECPNCGEKTSENHEVVQSDGLEGGRRLFFYTCQQRINELDDRHNRMASPEYQGKVKADMARRAVEIGADRLVGISAFPVGNCPTCGDLVAPWNKHAKYEGGYTCKPAQPEPAAPSTIPVESASSNQNGGPDEPAAPVEMPEAVRQAIERMKWIADHNCGPYFREWGEPVRRAADALESWWRTHSQPAPVRMTPELALVLDECHDNVCEYRRHADSSPKSKAVKENAMADQLAAAIAAVRAQAAGAQVADMSMDFVTAVRCLMTRGSWPSRDDEAYKAQKVVAKWLAELDAAERV